jgi:hypothetical protein
MKRKWMIVGLVVLFVWVCIFAFIVVTMNKDIDNLLGTNNSSKISIGPRDITRVNQITGIQNALRTYFKDMGQYPASLDQLVPAYMPNIPAAPVPADGTCSEADNAYTYIAPRKPTELNSGYDWDYKLRFCLGTTVSVFRAGVVHISGSGLITGQ